MAYLSLYRRRRPLTFSGMTGQEHVARTLGHALSRGQLAHAYLFCGPRGTGKTTAAKILARAANCRLYPAPEPCGECPPCRNIAAGVSLDVIEMDAASNRGIEEIRELRERTRYASGESRYKIYIIDEAHMLTNEACNAFLKTLEEPPPGVIFVLATTDPSRLPATVVSRCQRFDFHLLTVNQIMQWLRQVAELEGWRAEEEALGLIARLAEGSMRDALGLLEQCQAYGDDVISAEHVRTVTGATRVETIGSLVEAIAGGDLETGLLLLHQVTYGGRDLALFLRDLTFYFSRLLLSDTAEGARAEESYYGFTGILQRFQGRFTRGALLDLIELLHQVGGELRYAHHPQFVLEVALIRMLRVLHAQSGETPEREKAHAMPRQQTAAARSVSGKEPAPDTAPGGKSSSSEKKLVVESAPASSRPEAAPSSPADPEQVWPRFLQEVKKKQSSTYDYINMAQSHAWQGDQLVLTYRKGIFAAERIGDRNHRRLIEGTLSSLCGKSFRLKVVMVDSGVKPAAADMPREDEGGAAYPNGSSKTDSKVKEEGDDFLFEEAVKIFDGKVIDARDKED